MENQHAEVITATLEEMRQEYRRGIQGSEGHARAETCDYIVIRLDGNRFGIPAFLTREVLRVPRLMRVPRIAQEILGVVNLRGQIVAVTDLRRLLGLTAMELTFGSRLVVTETSGLLTALAVEKVEGMYTFRSDEIQPVGEEAARLPRKAVTGQIPGDEGDLVLLDLPEILARHDAVAVREDL